MKQRLSNWFGFLRLDLVLRQTIGYLLEENSNVPYRDLVSNIEKVLIEEAVKIKGSKRKAAKTLGIDYRTINRKTSKRARKTNIRSLSAHKGKRL